MKDVDLSKWVVTPHHTYFMHVQNAVDADAVGFSLVQIGDGSEPCIGLDSHEGDKYDGHVFVIGGKPRAGVEVQYFRDEQFITETMTDSVGRHSVRLGPGLYQYRFVFPGETQSFEILVKPGHRVKWEEMGADGVVLDTKERQIKFVTEELVGMWDNSDGLGFAWLDVLETLTKVADTITNAGGTLRLCSFAQFCRPDMVTELQARGIYAQDTAWRDAQFASAFRNMLAVTQARLLRLRKHDEARTQLERNTQFVTPTKIASPPGTHNYLALARAAAVFHASTLSSTLLNGLAVYDPNTDGLIARGPNTSGVLPSGFGGAIVVEQQWNPRA
ncbi:hypothetical protein EON83_10870 [bacterium]|nr:MAG: hypothetical protein EON83_10870 [bacterium]